MPTPTDYLTYLTGKGFDVTTSAGFAVNLSDTGVDNGTTTPTTLRLYRVGDPTVAPTAASFITAEVRRTAAAPFRAATATAI